MKKTLLLITTSVLVLSAPAMAQTYAQQPATAPTELSQNAAALNPAMEQVAVLQKEWARIKYQVADEDSQVEALQRLGQQAAQVSAAYPDAPEPKIWEGIILSTEAGIEGGLGALDKVKKAKGLFEASLKQNPNALEGSAYTSLGSLYYQVPGWPVGFGDDEEAEKNLKQALQINPNGIDPNFFYGDFLLEDGRYDEAKVYMERALRAPDRPSRPLADAGRRQEIKAALAKINEKSKNKQVQRYN
ncbi:MAG: tetratricopeptide repeat protein [Rhodospirillales bacterium]|nr:tetratricopeptide repeat protein [Alphaproteobacteria bacterium]USO03066.1 MAG: tetratricopeptide repeat protein [Rhodospirillales bacterium]